MASSRQVNILENLNAGVSWNYGFSASHQFKGIRKTGFGLCEFLSNGFLKSVNNIDLDAGAQTVNFYNLNGRSTPNAAADIT